MVDKKLVEKFLSEAKEEQNILEGCSFLDLSEAKKSLTDAVLGMESPLQVMVMGAFSTGKSSFVNALLGEDVTAVEALPTTAVITKLTYGDNENVSVHFQDDSTKVYPTTEFVRMTNENESSWSSIREKISYVERTLSLEMLKKINIIDSPGLEAKDIHTKITRKFINRADVVFWMFSAENAGTGTELKAIEDLDSRLLPIAIVNKMDTLDEEEDEPEEFLQEVQHKLEGKVRNVIGISAKLALEGRASKSDHLLKESNINQVVKTINEVIIPQSTVFKVNAFLENVANWLLTVSGKVDQYIKYRKNTATSTEYSLAKKSVNEFGKNIYKHLDGLIKYAQNEADNGNASACVFVAINLVSYLQILGGEFNQQNFYKIIRYLECGAEKNNLLAQGLLAYIYIEMGDMEKANHWAEKVEARYIEEVDLPDMKGDIQFILGELAVNRGDYRKGYSLYEQAVENSSTEAANQLGFAYQHGQGIDVDYKKAIKYYKIAAEGDEPIAQYNLGFMYYNGLGVAKDEKQALKWIKMSAENDHTVAQYSLATFYLYGDCGVNKNPTEAIKWLKLSAEQNDADAFEAQVLLVPVYAGYPDESTADYLQGVNLGEQIYNKYGDNVDCKEMVIQNVVLWLGIMYRDGGHGIEKNPQKSFHWFEIAAQAGMDSAQYALGIAYVADEGIPVDYDKAKYWLEKSAAQGYEAAIKDLADLNAMMNQSNSNIPPSSDNSGSDFNPLTSIIIAVALLFFLPPVGIAYIAWLFIYKIPHENKKIRERNRNT